MKRNYDSPPLSPPWTVEDIGAAFVVIDGAGQKLAYVYFEVQPGADGYQFAVPIP